MLFFAGDGPEDSPSSPPNKSDLQKVEDRSAVQALDSTGLQKLVKRKIGLLLKTHKALEAARLANAQPLDGPPNQERALQLPLGVDRKAMTEHLETFEKSEARHAALGRAVFEGVLRQNIADFERSRAAVDLHNTLELISKVHPEFCHDEVFVAALHLSDRLPRQGSSEPLDQLGQFEILDTFELTEEQHAALARLREATVDAAMCASKGLQLDAEFDRVKNVLRKHFSTPTIRTPVRPSEEEVQRYLSEVEQFMVDRQRSARSVEAAHTEQLDMRAELEQRRTALLSACLDLESMTRDRTRSLDLKLQAKSGEEASKALDPLLPAWLLPPRAAAHAVSSSLSKLSDWFGQPKELGDNLDFADEVNVTNSERRDMEKTRTQMRLLGFALGRCNEALTTYQATVQLPIPDVKLDGLAGHARTWADCLDWRAKKHEQQHSAGLSTLSKTTKLELLQESIDAAKEEVDETSASLQRMIRACMAVGYDRPCNELRALYNACAWYCRDGELKTKTKSKLTYPVFPLPVNK